jgi:uroporphyrinogen-III synthase
MAETVVVTASQGSFPGLVQALKEIRLDVEEHPLISFAGPSDWSLVDHALGRLDFYGAVAITSPRAAAAVAGRMDLRRKTARPHIGPAVWAGGSTTAEALGNVLGPVRTPSEPSPGDGVAAALAVAMLEANVAGPVLFPCGETRRRELPDFLRRHGIQVDEVVCYRSILADESAAQGAAMRATLVIVASPSVANLLGEACPPGSRPDLIAVGPTTAAAARAAGWSPVAVAANPTTDAVASAVRDILAARPPHE